MFYHVKELEFDARISKPDPAFATLLLEQFGGPNGELKAGMQYFVQSFAAKQPYPDKYDMLMDIATEEFSHLEIVGATITMLMNGVNAELKNASENTGIMQFMQNPRGEMDKMFHMASMNPHMLVETGGGPAVTDAQGVPFSGTYINANGDLTVDLRSNIAAESRAKIVYEYLLKFTDDPDVRNTLGFLMTREIAHFQQFSAALQSIEPNFPPGVLQGDPRFTHTYVNLSDGRDVRGPWNQGQGPWAKGEEWVYIERPIEHVRQTHGMSNQPVEGTSLNEGQVQQMDQQLSRLRSQEIKQAVPATGRNEWSTYESPAR
jgi:Mn-containing catalase